MDLAVAVCAFLGIMALLVAAFFYGVLAWGFVTYKVWNWFMVIPFAFNPITFVQAIAISTLLGFLYVRMNPFKHNGLPDMYNEDKSVSKKFIESCAYTLLLPWSTLLMVWIVKVIFIS